MLDLENFANWDRPLFPLSVVADGAGIKVATLRKWYDRNRIDPEGASFALIGQDMVPGGPGKARLLSFRMALHIGVMAALSKAGVDPVDGYGAAARWLHVSDGVSFWQGEPAPEFERLPGEMYKGDGVWTVLIHFTGLTAQIAKATIDRGRITFDLADMMFEHQTLSLPPKIVFLNTVQAHMQRACMLHLAKISD